MSTSRGRSASGEHAQIFTGGTRQRVYRHDEELVTVSRETFDALQTAMADRNLFSHIGLFFVTMGATLGLEMGFTYAFDKSNSVAFVLSIVSFCLAIIGGLSLLVAFKRNDRIDEIRKKLFDNSRLIADHTVLQTASGSPVRIDHLTSGSSPR